MVYKILKQRLLPDGDVSLSEVPVTQKNLAYYKNKDAIIINKGGKQAYSFKEFIAKHPKYAVKKPYMEKRIARVARGLPAVHHKKSSAPKSVWSAWFG